NDGTVSFSSRRHVMRKTAKEMESKLDEFDGVEALELESLKHIVGGRFEPPTDETLDDSAGGATR
ncbi:MAG: hypothetical protein ACPGUV_13090, partial [Polyangiales bacterium]